MLLRYFAFRIFSLRHEYGLVGCDLLPLCVVDLEDQKSSCKVALIGVVHIGACKIKTTIKILQKLRIIAITSVTKSDKLFPYVVKKLIVIVITAVTVISVIICYYLLLLSTICYYYI